MASLLRSIHVKRNHSSTLYHHPADWKFVHHAALTLRRIASEALPQDAHGFRSEETYSKRKNSGDDSLVIGDGCEELEHPLRAAEVADAIFI